jgi:hypothetical protein
MARSHAAEDNGNGEIIVGYASFIIALLLSAGLALLVPGSFGQQQSSPQITGQPWGPWTAQPGFPLLKARAKCDFYVPSDHTSSWSFQFMNDYPYAVDYLFKEEGTDAFLRPNIMGATSQSSLAVGERSGVLSSTLRGSCKELGGLKTQALCVVPKGQIDRCYSQYHLPRPTPENSAHLGDSSAISPKPSSSPDERSSGNGETSQPDAFNDLVGTCTILMQTFHGGNDVIGNALTTLTSGTQGGPLQNFNWESQPFNVTTGPNHTVQMLGRSYPYSVTKYPSRFNDNYIN